MFVESLLATKLSRPPGGSCAPSLLLMDTASPGQRGGRLLRGGRGGSRQRTSVAEMPGYPTRKLLLGGPETRTLAGVEAMLSSQSLQGNCELSRPWMVLSSLLLLSRGLRMRSRWRRCQRQRWRLSCGQEKESVGSALGEVGFAMFGAPKAGSPADDQQA